MRARGWALIDLAKATGLSVRTCCTLQQGQGNVGNYTRCCIALGVPTGLAEGNSLGRHLRLANWDDHGLVTILCGDALEKLKSLPDRSVHVIVTSPPYYKMEKYDGISTLGWEDTVEEYLDNLATIFRECKRVLIDEGTLWINIDDKLIDKSWQNIPPRLAERLKTDGWLFRHKYVWDKRRGRVSARDRLRNTDEPLYGFVKQGRYRFDDAAIRVPFKYKDNRPRPEAAMPGSVLDFPTAIDTVHPCPFDEALPDWCIRASCPPGGTVLDCFAGRGTTGRAAQRLGRRFVGIEISPKYVGRAWAYILQTEPDSAAEIEGISEPAAPRPDIPPRQPSPVQVKLRHAPCELKEANAIVAAWHRHHQCVAGHRFSIKCIDENGVLRGVAVVGRPVARMTCQRTVVEITRMVSDGTPNVCSFLYAACTHAARKIGYRQIQTFLLESEPATTLKALKDLGWKFDGWSEGGEGWQSRTGRRNDQPTVRKQRWVCILQSDAKSG